MCECEWCGEHGEVWECGWCGAEGCEVCIHDADLHECEHLLLENSKAARDRRATSVQATRKETKR